MAVKYPLSSYSLLNQCTCLICTGINETIKAEPAKKTLKPELAWLEPVTQKAKGIRALIFMDNRVLSTTSWGYFNGDFNSHLIYLIQNDEHLNQLVDIFQTLHIARWFARPCPVTPRHGFVDSTVVCTFEDLTEVWKATKKADPLGEVVVMPLIESKYSAILANNQLVIGRDNDGATSGKVLLTLPLSQDFKLNKESGYEEYGIKSAPYLELVASTVTPAIVQLRDGPKVKASCADFIPKEVVINKIVEITEEYTDLLKWESLCDALKGEEGTVIYHPNGSLFSHYGVHCVINELSYVTSFKPVVGEAIKSTENSAGSEINYRELAAGMNLSFSRFIDQHLKPKGMFYQIFDQLEKSNNILAVARGAIVTSLYGLHNVLSINKDLSRLIGFSWGLVSRLCLAADLGELRHFSGVKALEGVKDRSEVYQNSLINFTGSFRALKIAREIFNQGAWSGSYGGKAWQNCCDVTIDFINAQIRFMRVPCKYRFQKLVNTFNLLINVAHNGGKLMNKFVNNNIFDLAADKPCIFAASQFPSIISLYVGLQAVEQTQTLHDLPRSVDGIKVIKKKVSKEEQRQVDYIIEHYESDPNEEDNDEDID